MTSFFLTFEAIESRIASNSCPRGTAGRVQALRLRRCFQNYSRFRRATAIEEQQYIAPAEAQAESNVYNSRGHTAETGTDAVVEDARSFKLSLQDTPESRRGTAGGVSLREHLRNQRQLWRTQRIWGWKMRAGDRRELPNVGEQDVLPVPFPDGVSIDCSPDERALYRALRTGNPHNVLKEVMALVRFDGFSHYSKVLQTIPPNTFSEILHCLDPKYFVRRYGDFYEEVSPNYARAMGIPSVSYSGYHRFSTIFLSQIHGIMKARQRDHPMSLSDYRYLLKCARMTGNIKAAQEVWKTMTAISSSGPQGPVTPDGECFKHYLATMTWSEPASPFLSNRLRVIPDNLEPRSWSNPPYTLKGHRVGPDNGIKLQVSQIFRQMVKAGVPGDEETFCLMMMGFAREGDTNSVGLTLKRVWGIDVDALLTVDESELQPVKPYPSDSPFYPTAKILHTISHAYGINNDISTALRVVDYVSRQYSVRIPISVWNELLTWTFILARKRHGARIERDGTTTGQLPPNAVSNIWDTMTSEPYNITPTMEMYDRYISSLFQRQRFGEIRKVMSEGRRLHIQHVRLLSRQHILMRSTLKPGHPVSERRMRDLQFFRMRVMRNRAYLKKWVRLLIKRASLSLQYNPNWSAHDLPDLLKEWNLFIPKRVDYPIAAGKVQFWTDVVVDNGVQQRKWRVGYKRRQSRFGKLVVSHFNVRNGVGRIKQWERRLSPGLKDEV
jgi:hypothetical protein